MDIVSNDRCRQLAGLSCVDKAMHVQQWSSFASTKRTDANGEVSVKNMLIVAIRELGIEEVRHVSTSPKKGRYEVPVSRSITGCKIPRLSAYSLVGHGQVLPLDWG